MAPPLVEQIVGILSTLVFLWGIVRGLQACRRWLHAPEAGVSRPRRATRRRPDMVVPLLRHGLRARLPYDLSDSEDDAVVAAAEPAPASRLYTCLTNAMCCMCCAGVLVVLAIIVAAVVTVMLRRQGVLSEDGGQGRHL